MGDDGAGDPDVELVAAVLRAVTNPNRIRLLTGLHQDRSRMDLVDDLPISESGVSNHLRTMEEAGLVYRGDDGWILSPLGVFFAVFLDEHVPLLAEAVRRIEAAEAEAEQTYTDVPMPDDERERTIEWRKWELVHEDLEEILPEQEAASSDANDETG